MSEWISVKYKLPKDEETVIFYVSGTSGYFICIGYIIPTKNRGVMPNGKPVFWFVEMSENEGFPEDMVTHWMRLPEAPCEMGE